MGFFKIILMKNLFFRYRVSQQVLDIKAKNLKMSKKAKKVVKVCLHYRKPVHIFLQFDDLFENNPDYEILDIQ